MKIYIYVLLRVTCIRTIDVYDDQNEVKKFRIRSIRRKDDVTDLRKRVRHTFSVTVCRSTSRM